MKQDMYLVMKHVSVCNNKQRWNKDKCRCEYKELINKGRCDEGFIWNPSKRGFKCDKSYDVEQYFPVGTQYSGNIR